MKTLNQLKKERAHRRLNDYANFTSKWCRPLYWLYCRNLPITLTKIQEKYEE